MRISVSHRPLLEIEIRANPELIRSTYFRAMGYGVIWFSDNDLLLTIAALAFQVALPRAVPELPFHPLPDHSLPGNATLRADSLPGGHYRWRLL